MKRKYQCILFEDRERVATIVLNRPEKLNTFNDTLVDELHGALQYVKNDDAIWVVVLTGAGYKAFSAGADISQLQKLRPYEAKKFTLRIQELTRYLERLGKPTVAKINGFCLGGGLEIAMACDFRIASDKARFGQPEVNVGIIPGAGGTQRLTRLVGKTKAFEIVMLGEQFDAHEAYGLGLLNKVAPDGELNNAVEDFVQKLLMKSPIALQAIKLAINEGAEMDLDRALMYEVECFASLSMSEDSKEGLTAFLQKRRPEFKGK